MGSMGWPHKDSPDIHLVVATREELMVQQNYNSEEWRGALSVEAYLRREEYLYNQDIAKEGGLTPWMLVHQPDANAPRQVLCGCESLNKKALVSRDGKIEDVVCHAIGSVFCPPQHRGQGYAGRMMTEVGKVLRSWQESAERPVLFSILYSDIGKDFYAAKGWQPFPSAHVSLPAAATLPSSNVRLLKEEDLGSLCRLDEDLLRERLIQNRTGRFGVALLADENTLAWHHAREDFVSREILGESPEVKGVLIGTEPGSRAWAYFTRVWTNPQEEAPPTLHILRLVIEDQMGWDHSAASPAVANSLKDSKHVKAIAAIFSAAQSEAARWGMKEVAIWNPTSATLAAAQMIDSSATVIHREKESITSLQWYGKGSSWQDVDWVCNEKYGWC